MVQVKGLVADQALAKVAHSQLNTTAPTKPAARSAPR
jgi:hypothetical protein